MCAGCTILFNEPVTAIDCGTMCAPHNPSGKPFCCDICHAVPAAYRQEWEYLSPNTDLWHAWRGDECAENPEDPGRLQDETPGHMLLLACKGPALCQREYRLLSCRQFPFFPYITSTGRFIGLACEWEYENICWVLNHLREVTPAYRNEFVSLYDRLFAVWEDEFEAYAIHSENLRADYANRKCRFPILHRNGGNYLVSPASQRLERSSKF